MTTNNYANREKLRTIVYANPVPSLVLRYSFPIEVIAMWKNIIGFEGMYQVSDKGLVRNSKGKLLKPRYVGRKYLAVSLCKNGKAKNFYVHHLVANHFLDNKPDWAECINHKDGNKENNAVSNLEWSTYRDNNQHAYDNNLHGRGSDHYQAVLSENQVIEIIANGKGSQTYQQIADVYGVSKATIRDVLIRKTWKHIT